jgi:hypothetical protein
MGRPENLEDYVRFESEEITIYVSHKFLNRQKPGTWRLRFHIDGYGRFWLRLKEPWRGAR